MKIAKLVPIGPSLCFVLASLTSLCLSLIIESRHQTPHFPNDWGFAKSKLAIPPMGADDVLETRNIFAGNRANLHVWHGHQEIYTIDLHEYDQVEFDYYLGHRAWLYIFPDYALNRKTGIRISTHSNYPELSVTQLSDGRFEDPVTIGPAMQSQHGHFKILKNGNQIKYFRNGELFLNQKHQMGAVARFGVRGGKGDVWIDNLVMTNKGQNKFSENFLFIDRYRFAFSFFSFLLFFYFIYHFFGKFFGHPLFSFLTSLMVAASLSVTWYIAEVRFFSAQYTDSHESENDVSWEMYFKYQIEKKRIELARRKPGQRYLFLGGSQTFGEGVKEKKDRWSDLYCEELAKTRKVNCFNVAIQGASSKDYLAHIDLFLKYPVDHVLLNFSHNDLNNDDFKQDMENIIKKFLEKKTKVTLIQEPHNYVDLDSPILAEENHESLFELSKKYSLALVDMQRKFEEKDVRDSGQIWWDHVHLTSYGHKVFVDYLLTFQK